MDQERKNYATQTIILSSVSVNNGIKRVVAMMKLLTPAERKEVNEFLNNDPEATRIKEEFRQLKEDLNTYC